MRNRLGRLVRERTKNRTSKPKMAGGSRRPFGEFPPCRRYREISATLGVLEAWKANKTSAGFRNASMPPRIANYAQSRP